MGSCWIHQAAVWSLSMAVPDLVHPHGGVGLPLRHVQLSAGKPQMGPFASVWPWSLSERRRRRRSRSCYGNLFLIFSIWILGKWSIGEVYHNSSLDKQLNKEWKICILSEGTTKKCSHVAMISSVFNKGLAPESSPEDTDQIYHCGNVTWLVQCLSCESAEQRDVVLQHVQYLSRPFPLAGADFVFNIIEEWFFIVKVTNEFVLEVCFGFSLRPTPPLCCSRTLEPVIWAKNKIMCLFKMWSEWKVCWITTLRKWKCFHTRKRSSLCFAALSTFFMNLAEKGFASPWDVLDVSPSSWKESSCFTHHNLRVDSG